MITVCILASVRLYREGLRNFLMRNPLISVVGVGSCPEELSAVRPDVLLLDLGVTGRWATVRELRVAMPGTKVVGLGVSGTADSVIACAEAGLSAYLNADGTLEELVAVIERTMRGEILCPPDVTARLFARLGGQDRASPLVGRLTRREREIVQLIEQGLSNKEIARTLSIALSTVKNHIHSLLRKLEVKRRTDAVAAVRPRSLTI
ncbi:LuxR C-terminal-related transcriptional regulator [Nonomuraea sp. NPDC003201]